MYAVEKHGIGKVSKKLVMHSSSSPDQYQQQQQQQQQHQPNSDGACVDTSEEEGATADSTVCTGTSAGTEYHSTLGSLIASLAEEQEVVQRLHQQPQQPQQQQYTSLSHHSRPVLEGRPFEQQQQQQQQQQHEDEEASLYEKVATFTTSRDGETLTSDVGAHNPLLVLPEPEESIYPSAATAAATWDAPDFGDTTSPTTTTTAATTTTMSLYDNNDSRNYNDQIVADQDLLEASSRRQSQDIEMPNSEERAPPMPFLEEPREQVPLQEDYYMENDEETAEDAAAMMEVGILIHATLIRDHDESSHYDYEEGSENGETIGVGVHNSTSNDNDNINALNRPVSSVVMTGEESLSTMMLPPTTVLSRESTGLVTVSSDHAVVEAKPVEPPPPKAMSRKMICAVMAMLVVVIVALSVGFVLSAKNHKAKNGKSDGADPAFINGDESSNGGDVAGNLNNNSSSSSAASSTVSPITTSTPSPVAPAVDSQGGTATTSTTLGIPILQRLREQGGPLRCGVIPGPGLFYYQDDGEVAGFDASLCAAVAAAATGDPKNVEYQEFTIATILKNLKDGVIDIASAGATHTMERQVYVADVASGFQFTVPYLYQGMQLAGVPFFVECGDQGLEYIAACERDGEKIVICVVDKSTHQQKLSSFLPGQRLIGVASRDLLRESLANGTCNVIAHEGYSLAEPLIRQAGYTGEYMVGQKLFTKEPLAIITSPDDPQFGDFANSVLQSLIVAEANNITQSTADQFQQTSVFGEQYSDMFRRALAAGGNYGELFARYLEPYTARQHLNLINYDSPTSDTGLLYAHPFGSVTAYGQEGEAFKAIHGRGRLRCAVRSNRPGFAAIHSNGTLTGLEVDFCRGLSASIFEGGADAVHFVEVKDELEGFTALALDEVDVFAGATWNLLNDVKVPGVDKGFSFTQPYFYGGSSLLNSTGLLQVEEPNLCLATRQEDHLWSSFVYWIATGIIEAEGAGITQGMSNHMPDVFLFGSLYDLMFQDAILAVGNYHEIYQKHLQEYIPRSGRNQLNQNSGPQLYPYL